MTSDAIKSAVSGSGRSREAIMSRGRPPSGSDITWDLEVRERAIGGTNAVLKLTTDSWLGTERAGSGEGLDRTTCAGPTSTG